MRERILDINPDAVVNTYNCFFLPENASDFPFDKYDYVVDAIDTVTAKIELVMQCQKSGVPIMSSMGAGNKLDPTRFRVADIYKTSVDPLAKVMRRELKKRGIKKLKVVYSEEEPITPVENNAGSQDDVGADRPGSKRRSTPGSTAFVPSVAGLIIAGEVIKDLTNTTPQS
jgi:tRNA A37 threonylcarbamoyladenosine dehydratase